MQHELKILPQYFKAVKEGTETFEVSENDRRFKVGDTLLLKELNEHTKRINEVSYILYGEKYGLEEGYCVLGLKQEGIKLKNINLDNITLVDQIKKVKEEEEELIQACKNMDIDNMIEEFFDGMQARMGVLQKFGINADMIMEAYPKHLEKIKNRPRVKLKDTNNYEE